MRTAIENAIGILWALACIATIPLVAWLHWPTFVAGCIVYGLACFAAVFWEATQ